ncbi:MAG TPA: formylglycine-generating enzyme family protein [Gemmataceae bacterium]|jgi:formylglycine-generating enzyme required for sulfatase activity
MNALRILACLSASCLIALGSAHSQDDTKEITNSIEMKLVSIPAGKFVMGSPAGEAERGVGEDQHEVAITRPFYLGVYPVTQRQYLKVMGKNPSFFQTKNGGSLEHPVEQVRWGEAGEFCKRLSALTEEKKAGRTYRLPSEAEWEYACRAGTTTTFNVGDALSSKQANFNGNFPYGRAEKGPFLGKTAKVGSYPANAWGLYDMHGNVLQWCNDWYDPDYYKKSPKDNPKGPEKGVVSTTFGSNFFVVVRGGFWLDEGRGCRSARRFRLQQSEPYRWTGFRVACDVAGK